MLTNIPKYFSNLIRRQGRVFPIAIMNHSDFNIDRCDGFFHDLFQYLGSKSNGLLHGKVFIPFLFQDGLCALRGTSDGLGLVLEQGARGVSVKQYRSGVVHPSDEQGHPIGPGHGLLLGAIALSEVQGEIAHALRNTLRADRLVEHEAVVLGLRTSVVHQRSCVCQDPTHRATDVVVDLEDLLDTGGLHQRTCHATLHGYYYTFFAGDTDRG